MDCIFCKIVIGEIPCHKVYEDELFLGFLDIFPLSKGNTLLIPKVHYRWVNDVPHFGQYWKTAREIANRIEKRLGAVSTSYLTLGEEVHHAHIRIIPRYDVTDMYLTLRKPQMIENDEMVRIAKSLSS